MKRRITAIVIALASCHALLVPPIALAQARAWWGTNTWTGEVTSFPDNGWRDRPYSVYFRPPDAATNPNLDYDEYAISFPSDFDPAQSYPVWIKFLHFYGSFTGIYHHTFAENYCDDNQAIFVGFAARSGAGAGGAGGEWLGDNASGWDDVYYYGPMIRNDLKKLMNELCHLFNVKYFAFTGASMGGYSSFRIAADIPREHLGVVAASCPAIFYRDWVAGQDLIEQKVQDGWFNNRLVFLMQGTEDDTVPVGQSDRLNSAAPDHTWWNYYRVEGAGHVDFFMIWDPVAETENWGQIRPSVSSNPDLVWDAVSQWETAHPEIAGTLLAPMQGWSPPASTDDWYIPQDLVQWALDQQGNPSPTPTPTATGPTPTPSSTPVVSPTPTPTQTATSTASPSGSPVAQRTIPPLTDILAASEYLSDGDIPIDSFQPPAAGVYVATAAGGGNDANSGTSIGAPFEHLGKAIEYANNHPSTPMTIHIRGGTYYYKTYDLDQTVDRGNLYVTAYQDEEVTIRPPCWPGNPTSWFDERAFEFNGSYENITFDGLIFEGWGIIFNPGSPYPTSPMKEITIKNISASDFKHRGGDENFLRVFLETAQVAENVYGEGKEIFDDPDQAHYQIEGLILSNITVQDVDLVTNVGDENDANVNGMRITQVEVRNPPQGSGDSASDALAIVNSYMILIDHCTIINIEDDGIDTKSYNVCVVNTYVNGTGRNGVKFWRNGEMINSIVYDCTPINDGAFIIEAGPFRIVNSVLMKKAIGFAGSFNYDSTSSTKFEIVNSIFADLDHSFYVGTSNLQSKNSLYYDMPDNLFTGQISAAGVAELNNLTNCSGNLSGNPLFNDPSGEDFTIPEASPCKDAGTAAGVLLPSFDYYGYPRSMGSSPDIGPCEYSSYSPSGDEDGDGLLNSEEDLDMDGQVDSGETDPNDPDTDNDGFSDYIEIVNGSNPLNGQDSPGTIRVNFQPSPSARPAGYCLDEGSAYSFRGYGWQ